MINFFRKIRKQLADDNKFFKYSRYAIGEIVLVVIGILIALWINNQNQGRLKQERIETILVKIQNDIIADTNLSEHLISTYMKKDSIKNKVFNNQISYDKLNRYELWDIGWISLKFYIFTIQTSGYDELMDNIEDIPEKYTDLVRHLNFLYRNKKPLIEESNNRSSSVAQKYHEYLGNHQPWYAEDKHSGQISDAQIDYYLNNPKFKSQVLQTHEVMTDLMWGHSQYRPMAMQAYVMINEILGDKALELPMEIRTTSVKNEKDAERFIGTYELDSGPDNTQFGRKLEVILIDKDLYVTFEGVENPWQLLFFDVESPLFSFWSSSTILNFESRGENTLFIITGEQSPQSPTHWVKTSNQ
jgi:hypothetical protein